MTDTASFLDPAVGALDRLSPSARERLLAIGRRLEFDAGTAILHEAHETPFLAVVETGRVALRLRVPELGTRVTILTVEPGELIGWSALVVPYRATVDAVATEPVTLLAFDAPALRGAFAADPELAGEVLPVVLESVSERLTASWHQILDLFANRTIGPW